MSDPAIRLDGYQFNSFNLENGLFLFTHRVIGCGTTMSISVLEFQDLYTGPRYPEKRALLPECPRYCLDEKNLDRCDQFCECAYAREIMQLIRNSNKIPA